MVAQADGEATFAALVRAGRFAEAEAACRRELQRDPQNARALNNLANVLEELGRPDEAEAVYRQAIEAQPDFAVAHYNLGLLLQGRRRLEAAEAAYANAAAALRPDLVQAHNNRGAALRDLGRLDEALAAFDAAVGLGPDYADAQFNQAMCRLAMGDFARGWAQYEWRWRVAQLPAVRGTRLRSAGRGWVSRALPAARCCCTCRARLRRHPAVLPLRSEAGRARGAGGAGGAAGA